MNEKTGFASSQDSRSSTKYEQPYTPSTHSAVSPTFPSPFQYVNFGENIDKEQSTYIHYFEPSVSRGVQTEWIPTRIEQRSEVYQFPQRYETGPSFDVQNFPHCYYCPSCTPHLSSTWWHWRSRNIIKYVIKNKLKYLFNNIYEKKIF